MKEVKDKHMKKIYLNILKAIIILLYFFVLNRAYENVNSMYFERGIQLCTMIFLFITIFIFEVAYKKDDDDLAIQGIETLAISTFTLTCQHITKKFHFEFERYLLAAAYVFSIYFILKCIIIYTKGRKEIAEDFSDIKEIVKKDEPAKKEATKKKIEDKTEDKNEKIKTEENTKKKTTRKKKESKAEEKTNEKKPRKKVTKNEGK